MTPKNQFRLFGLAIAVVILILISTSLIKNSIRESSYVPVEAVLTNIYEDTTTPDVSGSLMKTAIYSYSFGNTDYASERYCFFLSSKDIGKTYTVKVDPDNPSILENTYQKGTSVFAVIICVVSGFVIIKSFLKEHA